ncbi:MAG: cupin domain-containing protein [Myxococcaceae bacterium]|nr:cupin domain-containing protein [Myxococcaceae bacterium]MCI0671447.1 cupin domain-containing protein [Myxococcaceae bacterium]
MTTRTRANPDERTPPAPALLAMQLDDAAPVEVGPGCLRRKLPSTRGAKVWVVDMAPGSQWPHVDVHDTGEEVYVVSGELIEGEQRFGPGTYVSFPPGSAHQPRTETGVRLFGFNLVAESDR